MDNKTKVLQGVRVLDFTIALAGSFVAWQMADLGAEVWKIEKYRDGDQARVWVPTVNGLSVFYALYNKNKKSVEVNLAAKEGKEIIYEMVKHVDVVLENFKSGSLDRLGLGYEELKKINPKIVFMSLSGFGGTGPLKKFPCYDAIAAARSGFAASNGEPDGVTMKAGSAIGDTLGGIYALNGVLMALINQRRTGGEGCRIDVGMSDVCMRACEETIMDYSLEGGSQNRFGNHDRFCAPYGVFEAADGWSVIIADSEERWRAMCGALGLERLQADPRFATNVERIARRDELAAEIEKLTKTLKRSEIEEKLLAAGVPASGVLSFIEAYTSNHANKTGLTQLVEQSRLGMYRFYRNPIKINDQQLAIESCSPLLGEHTREVLGKIGYGQERIEELMKSEVIGEHLT